MSVLGLSSRDFRSLTIMVVLATLLWELSAYHSSISYCLSLNLDLGSASSFVPASKTPLIWPMLLMDRSPVSS